MSKVIKFERLNNTRDLGGMVTQDNRRIKENKLIRSGHLYAASEADREKLSELVDMIIDFRTEMEKDEKPDPTIDGVENLHLPIFEELVAGITREEKSDQQMMGSMIRDPKAAREYMINTYYGFVTNEFSMNQYHTFIKKLLAGNDKAYLWHCTAGKDRAGFATIILLEIFGVDRDIIIRDYMQTNECIKEELEQIINMVGQKMGGANDAIREGLGYCFGAHEIFIEKVYDKIEEVYGDFDGFVREGLKCSDDEIAKLKELYLD
ncbi:MAG: tyrosine-protein phosphatase [Lachnospiraceae bacterium]|nr:tyrosine-protein phosphatase [Lachnospiraceae bacterium]